MTSGLWERGKYGLVVATAATTYPVSTAECKRWCSISTTADDLLVDELVGAATARFEADTGRTLINTIYNLYLDQFPGDGVVNLPRTPCLGSSTVTITYVDTNGTTQTFASSDYTVDIKFEPNRIYPAQNASWPSDVDGTIVRPIKVVFSCGYGVTQAGVPAIAKMAIKAAVAEQYRHREAGAMDEVAETGWRNAVALMRWEL